MWTSTNINPEMWGIRCKKCGDVFSAGEMLKKYKVRQQDAPPGKYYVKCPTCGTEDFLTDPEQLAIAQHLDLKARRKYYEE